MVGWNARPMSQLFSVALLGLMLLVGSAFAASIPVPPLGARVTDQTGTLSQADEQTLEGKLAAFERRKGGQIAVLIVPTTGAETIEQYSIRVVDQWRLGRKGVDDGVLVLVAKDDRKVRIEVGRGYEGVLPDAIANRIKDRFITPKFLARDYAAGLNDGVDRIIGVVDGEALPQPSSPKTDSSPASAATTMVLPIPPLTAHVVNHTHSVLTEAQASALEAKLAAFDKGGSRKVALLLVETTGDETGSQFADRVFDAWNLGDEGVLILMIAEPYDERINVGRGLNGVFTHPVIRRILDEDMSWPNTKLGDVAGELNAGVDRIIRLENGEAMPQPPKPEGGFEGWTWLDLLSPPPLGTWIVSLVGIIFLGICAAAVLGHKATLVRGGGTAVVVGAVPLIAGSGVLFALCFAALGFYLAARYAKDDGPDIPIDWNSGSSSSVSGWSIFGNILGMVASSAISSGGGGGGGFSGGGGGFSGGGASGSW